MVKVWNITDANGKGQNRMVLGKTVKPGRAVNVDEARLAKAHKVHRDVDAQLLYIGPRPPAWYLAKKKPARARADARRVGPDGRLENPAEAQVAVSKGHGKLPAKAAATEVAVEEKAEEEPAEETASEATEEVSEESTEDTEEETSFGRRRKRRK